MLNKEKQLKNTNNSSSTDFDIHISIKEKRPQNTDNLSHTTEKENGDLLAHSTADTNSTIPNPIQSVEKEISVPSKPIWKRLSAWLIVCIIAVSVALGITAYKYNEVKITSERYCSAYKNIKGKYDEIYNEYDFFHSFAVIVTSESGEKYHQYSCPHISDRKFYIYDIKEAEAKGYDSCADCFSTSTLDRARREAKRERIERPQSSAATALAALKKKYGYE